jgi:hypothetical protein
MLRFYIAFLAKVCHDLVFMIANISFFEVEWKITDPSEEI